MTPNDLELWKKDFQEISVRCSTSIMRTLKESTKPFTKEIKNYLLTIKKLNKKYPDVLDFAYIEIGQLIYALESQIKDHDLLKNKRGRKVWPSELTENALYIFNKAKKDKDLQSALCEYFFSSKDKDGEYVAWQKKQFGRILFNPPNTKLRNNLVSTRFNEIKRLFSESLVFAYYGVSSRTKKNKKAYKEMLDRVRTQCISEYPRNKNLKSINQMEREARRSGKKRIPRIQLIEGELLILEEEDKN